MCAITGFLTNSISSPDEMSNICERMSVSMSHRGPDNSDVWLDHREGISLGHQRLSILDLSENGHQPMYSKSGKYVMTYNGEIYNHLSLRKEITNDNNFWLGTSDTETLLAAIEFWGIEKALSKLIGMFAFALWDKDNRKLTLARDRLGEKPLYYSYANNSLIFGSELKSFKFFPGFNGNLCNYALSQLFKYAYIPTPYTIYSDTFKLPPGSFIVFSAERDGLEMLSKIPQENVSTYWSIKEKANSAILDPFTGTFSEAKNKSEALLSESVQMQLLSDVPLGSFLSGGIDSSLITAMMQSNSMSPIKTFSIGFDQDDFNEAVYAKKIANHLGTDHTELYLSEKDIVDTIIKLPNVFDEPFADSSQIPTYLVSSLAARDVKVALSGDGGDELFGGYNRYTLGSKIINLPYSLRLLISKFIRKLSPRKWQSIHNLALSHVSLFKNISNFGDKFHKLSYALGASSERDLYEILISNWHSLSPLLDYKHAKSSEHMINDLWSDDFTFQQNMMNVDLQTYLPDDILVKIDRSAMSHSLEGRVPLLDHRLVEFSLKLPLSMKIDNTGGKLILRKLLEQYVPNDLFEREKRGFAIPIETLLRGSLREWAENLLDPIKIKNQGMLDADILNSKWNEHITGKRNWQYQIWIVLMFQSWLEANN